MREESKGKRKAGRPALYDEPMEVFKCKLPKELKERALERGGSAWVRKLIEEAVDA